MKDLKFGPLCDVYAPLLTEKQRELMRWYYDDDLTLTEIAENTGVTRQAVKDAISRTETSLTAYEEKLGLLRKIGALRGLAAELSPEQSARLNAILDEE